MNGPNEFTASSQSADTHAPGVDFSRWKSEIDRFFADAQRELRTLIAQLETGAEPTNSSELFAAETSSVQPSSPPIHSRLNQLLDLPNSQNHEPQVLERSEPAEQSANSEWREAPSKPVGNPLLDVPTPTERPTTPIPATSSTVNTEPESCEKNEVEDRLEQLKRRIAEKLKSVETKRSNP
ncbi:MAG: hypothetical protein Tsb009_31240 [Planctomycetaceae bacterium]